MIYLNGTPVQPTRFSDNTSQVWKLPETLLQTAKFFIVTWNFVQEGEFLELAQLKMLLDKYNLKTTLKLSYLPYGRQDKEVTNGSTFALRSFAKLLNTLRFDEVIIMDPHSKVATYLINNSEAVYPIETLLKVKNLTKTNLFCYPDAGAVHKYVSIYDFPYIFGEKKRDQLTGNNTNYELKGSPEGKVVLIVDDICDGGMTFKLLATDLLKAGAKEVNLFVSHGLFSKGINTLKESGINKIFCQDGEVTEQQTQLTYRRI